MSGLVEPTNVDRLLASFRSLVRGQDPRRDYRCLYEYLVQSVHGDGTVGIRLTDQSQPMPDIDHVILRSGVPGLTVKPAVGSTVYLMFANGDPTKPFVLGYDSSAAQAVGLNAGTGTAEHLMTVEACVNLLANVLVVLGATSTPGGATGAAALASALFAFTTPALAQTYLLTAIAAAGNATTGLLSPATLAAIQAALASKSGDAAGTLPNVGCPNITGG